MTDAGATVDQATTTPADITPIIVRTAASMTTWLKFLAITQFISGALMIFTLFGIMFAWIPIWLGILLYQAGDRATALTRSADFRFLNEMLDKLRMYFIINCVLIVVSLVITVFVLLFMGIAMSELGLDEIIRSLENQY